MHPVRNLVYTAVFFATGCALINSKNANTVLDGVQLGCVFNSAITQEADLARACEVSEELIPLLRKLIAQREAGKAVGVAWEVTQTETRTAAPNPTVKDAGRD